MWYNRLQQHARNITTIIITTIIAVYSVHSINAPNFMIRKLRLISKPSCTSWAGIFPPGFQGRYPSSFRAAGSIFQYITSIQVEVISWDWFMTTCGDWFGRNDIISIYDRVRLWGSECRGVRGGSNGTPREGWGHSMRGTLLCDDWLWSGLLRWNLHSSVE